MKKTRKIVDVYNPNKAVEVCVTNTPKYEDEKFVDYDRTVTIKIRAGRDKEQLQRQVRGNHRFRVPPDFDGSDRRIAL